MINTVEQSGREGGSTRARGPLPSTCDACEAAYATRAFLVRPSDWANYELDHAFMCESCAKARLMPKRDELTCFGMTPMNTSADIARAWLNLLSGQTDAYSIASVNAIMRAWGWV